MTSVLPRPLFVPVAPYRGEQLISLVARAAKENEVSRLAKVLAHAGILTAAPGFCAFTRQDRNQSLAALLSVSVDEISSRFHSRVGGSNQYVSYFGVVLPRDFIEAKFRRVSPERLRAAPYDPMEWAIRPLSYCPETMQILIFECPHCERKLDWLYTKGPTKCQRCGHSLLDVDPEYAPAVLHSDLRFIASLVSFDANVRARALAKLPSPFSDWTSGQVFSGLIELCILTICAEVKVETKTLCSWRSGDFSFASPLRLVHALNVMRYWSSEFPRVVSDIAKIGSSGERKNSILIALKPLLKFTRSNVPETPLGELIREQLPSVIRMQGIPLKHYTKSKVLNVPRYDAVTTNEAIKLFGIAGSALSRLHKSSKTLVAAQGLQKGLTLYDAERLSYSIAQIRKSVGHHAVARILGIPACFVGTLADRGLINRISDADALLMTQAKESFDRESVHALCVKLEESRVNLPNAGIPIDSGLNERREEALVWAEIIASVIDGRLQIRGYNDSKRGFAKRALVRQADLDYIVRKIPKTSVEERSVSAIIAAQVLRWSDERVSQAAREGLIAGSKIGNDFSIPLAAIRSFRDRYVLPNEIAVLVGCRIRQVSSLMRKMRIPAVATVFHCSIYSRDQALAAFKNF